MEKITQLVRPERNRRYLYGVIEACLYAAAGFGLIDGEALLLLLAIPASALGLARTNVRNPA